MNNTAVISSGGLREKVKTERKQSALLEKLKKKLKIFPILKNI